MGPTVVRQQHDAVGVEGIERKFELTQAGIDIRQRQGGEQAESRGVRGDGMGSSLIHGARQRACRRIIAEMHPGR